ncbi:hypothetical protein B484DRAFT_390387, partial [Ochromonadaceae sp. CCMP2298]
LNGHPEVVQLLLGRGADDDVKGPHGETPMDLAADDATRDVLTRHAEAAAAQVLLAQVRADAAEH